MRFAESLHFSCLFFVLLLRQAAPVAGHSFTKLWLLCLPFEIWEDGASPIELSEHPPRLCQTESDKLSHGRGSKAGQTENRFSIGGSRV
jgi:hypothetical protein